MTTFPLAIFEQGLVITGHPTKSSARNQASQWLQTVRGIDSDTAADAVDGVYVANDAYWSDTEPAPGFGPPGFVGPDYPDAAPVTVVVIPNIYLVNS